MSLSSSNTNNYEHQEGDISQPISSITVDDIDESAPISVGSYFTVRSIFGGLNKIIKAIKGKFVETNENMLGISGFFTLPEHSSDKDVYSIQGSYIIPNLKREYTRAYFYFIDANGKSVFGAPGVWLSSVGDVYFLHNYSDYNVYQRSYSTKPFFVDPRGSAQTIRRYTQLTNFTVSYNANSSSISIELSIKGDNHDFTGYTLKYMLF